MLATTPARVELQNRFFISAPQAQRTMIRWALILFFVVIVVTGLLLNQILPLEQIDWEEVSRHVGRSLARNLLDLALFITVLLVTLAQLVYVRRATRRERIILTDEEIRYQSALPRAFQFMMPEWSAKWSEINRAFFRKKKGAYGPGAMELVLVTYRGEERKLRPYLWVNPEGLEQQSPWAALRKVQSMKPAEFRSAVLESPVVRFTRARLPRFDMEASWDKVEFPYALEMNRRALIGLGICALLMVYVLVDFVFNDETYASRPPYVSCVMLGLLAAVIAGRWMRAGDVPVGESIGLGIVLGATFGAALYPGLLRINQLTDPVGLQTHVYQLQTNGSLAPLRKNLPVLAFPRYADYWSSFSAGSLHEFRLRKGGLGFYQVDMAPINDAMHRYYRNRR